MYVRGASLTRDLRAYWLSGVVERAVEGSSLRVVLTVVGLTGAPWKKMVTPQRFLHARVDVKGGPPQPFWLKRRLNRIRIGRFSRSCG